MTSPSDQFARLDDRSRAILDFERDWRVHQGRKDEAIADRFGISSARYYQLLSRAVSLPAALEHDPLTVHRIHRRRRSRGQSGRDEALETQRGR